MTLKQNDRREFNKRTISTNMGRIKGNQQEIVKLIGSTRGQVPLLLSLKEQEDRVFPEPGGRMVAATVD